MQHRELYSISYTIFLLFHVWFFGQEACGILAPWPGTKPALPTMEDEVLTAWPQEKSPNNME